jgi:hypothetical protein
VRERLRPLPDPLAHRLERLDQAPEIDVRRPLDGWRRLSRADPVGGRDEVLNRLSERKRGTPAEPEGTERHGDREKNEGVERSAPRFVFGDDDGQRVTPVAGERLRRLHDAGRAGSPAEGRRARVPPSFREGLGHRRREPVPGHLGRYGKCA